MPKRYPKDQRDRAVRMVLDRLDEYPSLYAACESIAPKLGVGSESLRRWTLQAQIYSGQRSSTRSLDLIGVALAGRREKFKADRLTENLGQFGLMGQDVGGIQQGERGRDLKVGQHVVVGLTVGQSG